jgi:hypothetical protein
VVFLNHILSVYDLTPMFVVQYHCSMPLFSPGLQ